jgi:hypothetical protein
MVPHTIMVPSGWSTWALLGAGDHPQVGPLQSKTLPARVPIAALAPYSIYRTCHPLSLQRDGWRTTVPNLSLIVSVIMKFRALEWLRRRSVEQ